MKRRLWIPLVIALAAANGGMWWASNQPFMAADADGRLQGLSYSPYRNADPLKGEEPKKESIAADIDAMAGVAREIRTYSAIGAAATAVELAGDRGLKVTAGAWIDTDKARNQAELEAIVKLARREQAVQKILVGNEALLRGNVTVGELINDMKWVRRQTKKPVGTAEPWHVWLANPQLAAAADFIGIHVLLYWEGFEVHQALQESFERIAQIRKAYPGKPIVVTEAGWPSAGAHRGDAVASIENQAWFDRAFIQTAAEKRITHFVIEAFDQPWKAALEGNAGSYWGLFDADGRQKFPLSGPVEPRPLWPIWAGAAVLFGVAISLPYLLRRQSRPGTAIVVASMSQIVGTALGIALLIPAERYLDFGDVTTWAMMFVAEIILLLIATADAAELASVAASSREGTASHREVSRYRKVSIHVAIHNEPPEMMRETLLALAKLDWPEYEVLVIDNNTKDPAVWQPVERLCEELGPRFRFFHLDPWPGFKAGALNFALKNSAPDAEVIAVIDADYIVEKNWLKELVPHFDDGEIGIVQAPQNYRDANESIFKRCCFWEYAGFFHIGMVARARHHAIIMHGTMTMVRRSAIERAGGWGEWCICEDAELGLRLFADGWKCIYTTRCFGRGLMPDTLDAYMRQRFRWAFGATQIMRRHARLMLSGKSPLNIAQRYHFVAGWLPWMADGAGLVFTAVAFLWTTVVVAIPALRDLPDPTLTVPALSVLAFKVIRDTLLYKFRVRASFLDTMGAMLAGLALSNTVAKAMLTGLFTAKRPFLRTPKCENRPGLVRALLMARNEAVILAVQVLIVAAFVIVMPIASLEEGLWLATLLVLCLPSAATLAFSLINASGVKQATPVPVNIAAHVA